MFLHCSTSFHFCCHLSSLLILFHEVVTKDDATTSTFAGFTAQKCRSSEFLVEIADLSDVNNIEVASYVLLM